jgi:hypothetical protein
VAGETLEFGFSGLLFNSNLLMYDRRRSGPDAAGGGQTESLWSQLLLRAVSGPAVGTRLTLLPAQVVIWEQWRRGRPDTRVILPDPARKRVYKRDAYAHYYATGEPRFPVQPLPAREGLPWMTPVVAERHDGAWRLTRAVFDLPLPNEETPKVYALWFAWHAHHPDVGPPGPPP